MYYIQNAIMEIIAGCLLPDIMLKVCSIFLEMIINDGNCNNSPASTINTPGRPGEVIQGRADSRGDERI